MAERIGLHEQLCNVLSSFGVWLWGSHDFSENENVQESIEEEARKHVYYQPPESFKMSYPCIVYEKSRMNSMYADNNPYTMQKGYTVTVIDKNPDSAIPEKVARLPMSRFDRHMVVDNLHHDVFTIYY